MHDRRAKKSQLATQDLHAKKSQHPRWDLSLVGVVAPQYRSLNPYQKMKGIGELSDAQGSLPDRRPSARRWYIVHKMTLRSPCGVCPIAEYCPVHNRIHNDPYNLCELLDRELFEHPMIQLVSADSA